MRNRLTAGSGWNWPKHVIDTCKKVGEMALVKQKRSGSLADLIATGHRTTSVVVRTATAAACTELRRPPAIDDQEELHENRQHGREKKQRKESRQVTQLHRTAPLELARRAWPLGIAQIPILHDLGVLARGVPIDYVRIERFQLRQILPVVVVVPSDHRVRDVNARPCDSYVAVLWLLLGVAQSREHGDVPVKHRDAVPFQQASQQPVTHVCRLLPELIGLDMERLLDARNLRVRFEQKLLDPSVFAMTDLCHQII
jgi:hypothetical protein